MNQLPCSSIAEIAPMSGMTRRQLLQVVGVGAVASVPSATVEASLRRRLPGWVQGHMSGAEALVEAM